MLLLKFIKNPVTVRHHLSSCQQEGGRQPGRRSCPGALPFLRNTSSNFWAGRLLPHLFRVRHK